MRLIMMRLFLPSCISILLINNAAFLLHFAMSPATALMTTPLLSYVHVIQQPAYYIISSSSRRRRRRPVVGSGGGIAPLSYRFHEIINKKYRHTRIRMRRATASPPPSCCFMTEEETTTSDDNDNDNDNDNNNNDNNSTLLLNLISQTPRNAPTPKDLTNRILQVVRELEEQQESESAEQDSFDIEKLAGVWELLWTAQDTTRSETKFTFINPLENQSYSNNPFGSKSSKGNNQQQEEEQQQVGAGGRANPVLPRPIQDRLEEAGIISTSACADNGEQEDISSPLIKSTQSIDVKSGLVRNVVSFGLGTSNNNNTKSKNKKKYTASLTVTVRFVPDTQNKRKINVKFQSCRIVITNTPLNINIPLGIFGPTGWLCTNYIDNDIRITRGHKGSVFILQRPITSSTSL